MPLVGRQAFVLNRLLDKVADVVNPLRVDAERSEGRAVHVGFKLFMLALAVPRPRARRMAFAGTDISLARSPR